MKIGIKYVKNGKLIFTNNKILNLAYVIISEAKEREGTCKEWRGLHEAGKSWPNFKTHFF